MTTLTNGLTHGNFTSLRILSGGVFQDILTLIGAGSGAVTSASAPLAITSGVMSIDLSTYITTAAVNALLADYRLTSSLFSGVTMGAGLVSVAGNGILSIGLPGSESRATLKLMDDQGNVRGLSSSATGTLVWNTASVALSNDLVNFINTISVTAPLTISGSGASRALATLWKPSAVTVGTGLFALTSDALGTMSLSLTGAESRVTLKIQDSNATVRNLTSSTGGVLTWDGTSLVNTTQLALKADDAGVTSAFAGVQVQLAAKAETTVVSALSARCGSLVDAVSGISTGDANPATGPNHRIAVFESQSIGPGKYFYGMALVQGWYSPGVGFWGGTGTAFPEQARGSATQPHMILTDLGRLGVGTSAPTQRLHVGNGNILCSGSITGASKSFDIEHPDPAKPGMRLRHYCIETDSRAGSLIYRRQFTAPKGGLCHVPMPSWFPHLTANVMIFVSPFRHFGQAWGEMDTEDPSLCHVTVSKGGIYNVMITGDRNDACARSEMCPAEIEYTPSEQLPGEDPLPM